MSESRTMHVLFVHPDRLMDNSFSILERYKNEEINLVAFEPSLKWKYPISIINYSMCRILSATHSSITLTTLNDKVNETYFSEPFNTSVDSVRIHLDPRDEQVFASHIKQLLLTGNPELNSENIFLDPSMRTPDETLQPMNIVERYFALYQSFKVIWNI